MTDATPAPDLARKARAAAWPVWLVVLAVALAFGSLCSAEFTWWDDAATVHHNDRLNPPTLGGTAYYWTHAADGLWVPITYTAWAGLAALARLDTPGADGIALNPWVFHGANVLVHVLAALAVLGLLRRLTKSDVAACAGTLLFALHPVQVEAVAWVSGMKDVLAGGLGLAALLCYVEAAGRQRRDGRLWYALATLAFVAAMLAKPSAATVPLLAATIDWFLLRRPLRRVAWAAGPWLVLAVPVLVVARLAQGVESVANVALWARPLVMGDSLAFYLYKLVWPLHLGVDYGRRPAVLLAAGRVDLRRRARAAGAGGGAVVLGRRRRPWLLTGGLLFVAALLPVSGLGDVPVPGHFHHGRPLPVRRPARPRALARLRPARGRRPRRVGRDRGGAGPARRPHDVANRRLARRRNAVRPRPGLEPRQRGGAQQSRAGLRPAARGRAGAGSRVRGCRPRPAGLPRPLRLRGGGVRARAATGGGRRR